MQMDDLARIGRQESVDKSIRAWAEEHNLDPDLVWRTFNTLEWQEAISDWERRLFVIRRSKDFKGHGPSWKKVPAYSSELQ